MDTWCHRNPKISPFRIPGQFPPWLKCRHTEDGFFVSYAEGLDEDSFVLEALRIIGIDPLDLGSESYRIVREELLRMKYEHGDADAIERVRVSMEHHLAQIEYLVSLAD